MPDQADRKRLFEPFSQADSSTTRRFGGTGLGLAISRQLVTAMGGALGVESQIGRGSTFWFTVPLGVADGDAGEAPLPEPGSVRCRVLVVDDNRTGRLILADQLGTWGTRVDAVEDGESALRVLTEAAREGDPYTVALLDLSMPGMDGVQLAGRISAEPDLAGTALVLLTSNRGISPEAAHAAGATAQLTKPVRPSRLQRILLDASETTLDGRWSSADVSAVQAPGPPGHRPSRGHVLVVEDNHVNQLVAVGMLEQLGYTTEVAGDGWEALVALDRTGFAAVLMDCQMPEMDGYVATEQIRGREPAGQRTPIIAMTASATEAERARCLSVGMDDFITKPVTPQTLASALARWIPVTPTGSAQPPGASNGVLDVPRLEMLRTLKPGDTSLLDRAVSSFLSSSSVTLEQIAGAVAAGAAAELAQGAHRLKGSASNLGVPRVAAVCAELELLGDDSNLGPAPEALTRLSVELDTAVSALLALP